MKMFQKIQELIDEPETIVCVLIDEVKLQAFFIIIIKLFAFLDKNGLYYTPANVGLGLYRNHPVCLSNVSATPPKQMIK